MNLEKSVGSRFLAQTIDSTALQKDARLTDAINKIFNEVIEYFKRTAPSYELIEMPYILTIGSTG
jgi:hypothetical protein